MTAVILFVPLAIYLIWLWLHNCEEEPVPEERVDMVQMAEARKVMEKPEFEMSTGKVFTRRKDGVPHAIYEKLGKCNAGKNGLLTYNNMYLISRQPVPFNNQTHLKKFLDYLLRTDRAQKWTTATTPNCLMFLNSKKSIYKLGAIRNRNKAVKPLFHILRERWEELQMVLSELYDENGEPLLVTEEKTCMTILERYMSHVRQTRKEYQTLLYIVHLDIEERPYHIHEIIVPCQLIV